MEKNRQHAEAEKWFHQKATDYVVAQAMFHLNQEGVLRKMASTMESIRAEVLGAELGLDSDKLDSLLFYLSAVDRVFITEEPGRYALSEFGRAVVERYGKQTAEGLCVNMFDVRVGAYGPVWTGIGEMLSNRAVYGEDIKRAGQFSESGLYATARGMAQSLLDALVHTQGPVVEMGVETGLLEQVGKARPELPLWALDRSANAIAKCTQLAAKEGVNGIHPLEADLFQVNTWAGQLPRDHAGTFFTIHLHEFMAAGRKRMVEMVGSIQRSFPGWRWVFFEQDRPDAERPPGVLDRDWYASHSNILIHHFIKNGSILKQSEWTELISDGGAIVESVEESGYLDYKRYIVQL